ncbi:hypothetical protein [Streptosporangium vulgare]|uniref:Secreted protein n=1 Tax=Streptosporangium vulgare TaxID=46190 RepID=A0ABV5TUN3_9ACTN
MKSVFLAMVLLLAITGCGTVAPAEPLPVSDTVEIIRFGDAFLDVATACDGHGHRIYQTASSTEAPVVIDDASCPGGSNG